MMEDIKAQTVLFLTRDGANDLDRAAAKILARCDVEVRHTTPREGRPPAADVMFHADHETVQAAKTSDAAGRIENALRQAADSEVRYLQWVEERRTSGPKSASGIGDGSSGPPGATRANSGLPPRYHDRQPDDLKRDKPHEERPPGRVN
jgi:hypothetical protein